MMIRSSKSTFIAGAGLLALGGCNELQSPPSPGPDYGGLVMVASVVREGAVILSASGSGHVTLAEGRRTFAFNALKRDDGTATGHIQVKNRNTGFFVHGEVFCVVDIGAGIIGIAALSKREENFGPGLLPGDGASLWAVRDNGEGANADPDEFTNVETTYPATAAAVCASPGAFGFTVPFVESLMQPLEDGNIQVR